MHGNAKPGKPGDRYGQLVLVEFTRPYPPESKASGFWLCQCDCGKRKEILLASIRRSTQGVRSCGHLLSDILRGRHTKHGMTKTSEYSIWSGMKKRCAKKTNAAYKYYGARGVKVCDRWTSSFEAFFSDVGPRPAGMSIDRINNDGDYEPSNCRWVTPAEQNRNKRKKGSVFPCNRIAAGEV